MHSSGELSTGVYIKCDHRKPLHIKHRFAEALQRLHIRDIYSGSTNALSKSTLRSVGEMVGAHMQRSLGLYVLNCTDDGIW